MMTDQEKLVTLFHDFGIEPEVVHSKSEQPFRFGQTPKEEETDKTTVTLVEGTGYSGFCCTFVFDKDGKFESFGVYE